MIFPGTFGCMRSLNALAVAVNALDANCTSSRKGGVPPSAICMLNAPTAEPKKIWGRFFHRMLSNFWADAAAEDPGFNRMKDVTTNWSLQRGGSNVHFAISASMLSIPPASEALAKIFEPKWSIFKFVPDEALEPIVRGFLNEGGYRFEVKAAMSWIKRRKGLEAEGPADDETSARYQEYMALSQKVGADQDSPTQPEFENEPYEVPGELRPWFDLFAATRRLREVRAYCGFTRIQPWPVTIEMIKGLIADNQIAPLSASPRNWFPAIEVRGEGIFVRLSEEKVKTWASNKDISSRAAVIDAIYKTLCEKSGMIPVHDVTPRLLLVHSLAHMLIRRLSLDSGYSSPSLRERLYVNDGDTTTPSMAGILIYTATPDSDGSLGGLVSLATPERMKILIMNAIQDAAWCGNDPVCLETVPELQGDKLSGASCHNCLLLPETACEKFNRELDRVTLVGNKIDDSGSSIQGFFSDLLEQM